MAGEQTIVNEVGGRKIGERGRFVGENPRCNGENLRKIGGVRRSVGDGLGSSGDEGVHRGGDAKNMGTGGGPLGTDSDALRTLLRDWGSRPENRNADGSRPVWGKNFPGQGALLLRGGFRKNF
jgi:hypothetical protein